MATVKITYTVHNVPAGKCTSVFTAQGCPPITTDIDVPASMAAPVTVDVPQVTVTSS